jgi:hypothetical protein
MTIKNISNKLVNDLTARLRYGLYYKMKDAEKKPINDDEISLGRLGQGEIIDLFV